MNQPLGHSTSGSHERYKSRERLNWEKDFDPLKKMREWILENELAPSEELDRIEKEAVFEARDAQLAAWKDYNSQIESEREDLLKILRKKSCKCASDDIDKITLLRKNLQNVRSPIRKDNFSTARKILRHICLDCPSRTGLQEEITVWLNRYSEGSSFQNCSTSPSASGQRW